MMEKKEFEMLQSTIQEPGDSLKKTIAVMLWEEEDPVELMQDAAEMGLDGIFRYDVEENELEEMYEKYYPEIRALQSRYPLEYENMLSYAQNPVQSTVWRALQKTLLEIKA
jgi:hypothetical protein